MKTIIRISILLVFLCACSSKPDQGITQSPALFIATIPMTETVRGTVTRTPPLAAKSRKTQESSTSDADSLKTETIATSEAFYSKCYPLPARDSNSEISPDGRWRAMWCRDHKGESDSLQAVSVQGDKRLGIYYTDYVKGMIPANDFISPIHWSSDGKYLYAAVSSGSEGCCFMSNELTLVRLDLNSGKQDKIVSYPDGSDDPNGVVGVDFSISPSDRYALYIPQDVKDSNLHILDLITHRLKEIEINFDYEAAGRTLMSNDDKIVVLVLMQGSPTPQPDDPFLTYGSIVVINLETGLQRRLLSGIKFDDMPMPIRWKDDSRVELLGGNDFWLLNIHTQELTKIDSP